MNILVVKMSAIGDVIHTLPAVDALREHFPNARITWLVEEAASGIVERHHAVDRVLVSRRERWVKGLVGPSCLQCMKGAFHFVKELRDTVYDLVIDFQGLTKSAVMVSLCRGRRKVGYNRTREFSYIVLDERIPPYDIDKHAVLRYLNLLKYLGVDTKQTNFNIPFDKTERLCVGAMLRQRGWTGQRIVSINAVAKWRTKLWDSGNFSRLAQMLIKRLGCAVVFTGSKSDQEEIARIISKMDKIYDECIDISGETDLKQLGALYEMSKCVVSTDTGPMHLAAAVGTPIVALFGPTAPWRTGPLGDGHVILRAGFACSPCFRKKCDNILCMRHISVEQVFDAVAGIVKRRESTGQSTDFGKGTI